MKKHFLVIIPLVMLVTVCAGGAKPVENVAVKPAADELDAAIRETSDYLNKQLPKGNKLVILNIQSEFPALSEYIIDELIANTVNDRVFSVVDRRQLDAIRAELDFQMSGEVDDETAQTLGRMAGAQIIISGAVSRIGDLYRLRFRALGVQNAQIEGQFNRNIPDGSTVAALVQSRATGYGGGSNYGGTGGGQAAASAPASQSSPTQAAPVVQIPVQAVVEPPAPAPVPIPAVVEYKIGDTGPAGGLVFYDKGYVSDGWRYLEAASRDAPTAHWGPEVNGTREGIGTGKQNTTLIMRTNDTGTAAHRCREYRQGGYDDWFLPSKDELNLMYQNLKQKGLGGFTDGWYWSSSWARDTRSWNQRFSNGSWDYDRRTDTYSVRPVRQF